VSKPDHRAIAAGLGKSSGLTDRWRRHCGDATECRRRRR